VKDFHDQLATLEQFQTEDFYGILKAMEGLPVVIRLLDAPLHEFLPHAEELIVERENARSKGESKRLAEVVEMLNLVNSLREANPMLGHRGCRVGMTMPEIYEMQVRAIITAACRLTQDGLKVFPEVMIPIVSHVNELKWLRPRLRAVANATREAMGVQVSYQFGTMIEVPRAALTAGEIAQEAEFFSFGSNDLTQMTYAFSRDDAEPKFLKYYVEKEILPHNPFSSLDTIGVGRLMRLAAEEGRAANPGITLGICGEHGGDPRSVAFCHELGLNYVSASPFRVPVSRLAAAQAALGKLTAAD
jgi:pyruvate,orthophosphate dikinase